MPKKVNTTEDKAEKTQASGLEKAWQAHIEKYQLANPVKFAQKQAAGAFDKIPAGFTGKDELEINS